MKPLPKRLSISIGGHFGPSFSVRLEAGVLTYTHSKPVQQFPPEWGSRTENIQPSSEQWRVFRGTLDRLDVWSWQADYPNPGVCDGTVWSAEIVYANKSVVSGGSNCYPGCDGRAIAITDRREDDTFKQFCRAVSDLIGKDFA